VDKGKYIPRLGKKLQAEEKWSKNDFGSKALV
jgi:hypothetical protein